MPARVWKCMNLSLHICMCNYVPNAYFLSMSRWTGSCAGLLVLMERYDLPIDFSTQCSQAASPEASSAWTCVGIKTKINTVYSGKADRQMVEERVSRESKKTAY